MNIQINDPDLIEKITQISELRDLSPEALIKAAIETYTKQLSATPSSEMQSQALLGWQAVYEGLTEEEIEAVEAIALDRSQFIKD